MNRYQEHREDCPFTFAPLDVCDCVQKNMADRIEALERQVKAADALAAYVERDAKMTSIAFGTAETSAWKKQSPHAAELLEAYRATKEGGA